MPSKKSTSKDIPPRLENPTTPFEQFKQLLKGHVPTDKELEEAYYIAVLQSVDKEDTPTSPKIPPPTRSVDIKEDFIKWLDKHRDDIKYATKGYVKKVKDAYEKESGNTLTTWQFRRMLDLFRTQYNCPIEYVDNKYYKPNRSKFCVSHYTTSTVEN